MAIQNIRWTAAFALLGALWSTGAAAQEQPEPRRIRIGVGPQLVPRYPGADGHVVRPFFDLALARGDTPFEFEAADESAGLSLLRAQGFSAGPAIGFEGARRTRDVPGVRSVGFTVEAGAFVQYSLAAPLRARLEVRQGIGGHRGLVGVASVDYIARDRDDWLFAIGPRVTASSGRYQRAYFGVPVASVAASGLPAFEPSGGVHAVGANASYLRQITPRWGVLAYGKYDRLIDDAAESPIVRRAGSRDQWSGGLALTYTFSRQPD
ncbi:MipA/OmpV family protein [Sphingomonas radiodurans]|uniref:MipA/OmpV family protein n=1 Tax=Sphingomonas radiodurans TaxID=2890321 RepID=UPI001E511894|nr:MipA/OmpV family protein [Sphingomonas radiodurans]WBH16663.1 MipA/OmpV family protein [Sphingomonas radiodurans]